MTAEQVPPRPRWRFSWTSALLVGSLALNVFVLSAGAARFFFPPPPERFVGATYAQLVPRRFLADLDGQRRKELLAVLRKYARDFRDSRLDARKFSAQLADALENEPYDQRLVAAAIDAYAGSGNQLVSHGRDAAMDFVSKLTPGERKLMAVHLRQRDRPRHRN